MEHVRQVVRFEARVIYEEGRDTLLCKDAGHPLGCRNCKTCHFCRCPWTWLEASFERLWALEDSQTCHLQLEVHMTAAHAVPILIKGVMDISPGHRWFVAHAEHSQDIEIQLPRLAE